MTDYVVMFPADNESEWEAGTEADHQATFDTDQEFAELLKSRGGAVIETSTRPHPDGRKAQRL